MRTTALHPEFGVEVHGIDLAAVTHGDGYPQIRGLFEDHSLLLFRNQQLDEERQMVLASLFGPIEDRSPEAKTAAETGGPAPKPVMSRVSNNKDDRIRADAEDRHLQNLQANFLWHTDSTFLPVPALANVLAARVLPSSGGATQFVSTRAAWAKLSAEERQRLRGAVFRHRYAHSRAKISPELAEQELFCMWRDQAWRAVWPNPVNGKEALYIASHVFAVEGMDDAQGQAWVDRLIQDSTGQQAVYSHDWRLGDVLIWDERATLHRGQPWPYEEERTLSSVVASSGPADGLDLVRPRGPDQPNTVGNAK